VVRRRSKKREGALLRSLCRICHIYASCSGLLNAFFISPPQFCFPHKVSFYCLCMLCCMRRYPRLYVVVFTLRFCLDSTLSHVNLTNNFAPYFIILTWSIFLTSTPRSHEWVFPFSVYIIMWRIDPLPTGDYVNSGRR
jgi:hypothetical protein